MWRIMDHFKVLPTDDRFQNLSNDQIGFILESMQLDYKEQALAAKGVDRKNHFEDDDESFWKVPMEDFVALKEYHDEENISNQLEELVGKESMKKARERFNSTEEYNKFLESGGKLARQMEVDTYIEDKLKAVYEEARELEEAQAKGQPLPKKEHEVNLKPTEVDTIKDAIDIFKGSESETEEDFYI